MVGGARLRVRHQCAITTVKVREQRFIIPGPDKLWFDHKSSSAPIATGPTALLDKMDDHWDLLTRIYHYVADFLSPLIVAACSAVNMFS